MLVLSIIRKLRKLTKLIEISSFEFWERQIRETKRRGVKSNFYLKILETCQNINARLTSYKKASKIDKLDRNSFGFWLLSLDNKRDKEGEKSSRTFTLKFSKRAKISMLVSSIIRKLRKLTNLIKISSFSFWFLSLDNKRDKKKRSQVELLP